MENKKAKNSTNKVDTKKKEAKKQTAAKTPAKTKNTTKNNKKQNTKPVENSNEISKLIKIVLIVTGIMLVFYGITILATERADKVKQETKDTADTSDTAEIQYENIIIGTMLNYSGTYYVLIKEKDDTRLDEYESLITTIKASEDAPTFYSADLSDAFNKKYLSKEENYYPSDLDEFAVTGTTLLKIKDNKIDSVYDNHDAIKNKLKDLL